MDYALLNSVKEIVEGVYKLFDTVEETGVKPERFELPLRQCFKIDIMRMVMYFSASDGKLSDEEITLLNKVFDMHGTADDYIKMIKEYNIYSTEFESGGFFSLEMMSTFDKAMGEKLDTPGTGVVIGVMEDVAKLVIQIDGDIDRQEKEDFKIYFSNLKDRYLPKANASFEPTFRKNSSIGKENTLKDYYLKKKKSI